MSDSGLDVEPVSTRRGIWSVVLAVASPVVGFVVGVVGILVATTQGGMGDPGFAAALGVSNFVATFIAVAMVIAAVVLGVISIARARPQVGRPRRTAAIVLGSFGIGIGALVGLLYVWLLSPLL